jgi:hypothetical protein
MKIINRLILIIALLLGQYSYSDEIEQFSNDDSYSNIKKFINSEDDSSRISITQRVNINDINIPNCEDLPLQFNKCIPSICKSIKSYGKVYRKISGYSKDGSCIYIERTKDVGGMDCTFQANQLDKIQYTMENYLSAYGDTSTIISDVDLKNIDELFTSSCILVKDVSIRDVIKADIEDKNLTPTDQALSNEKYVEDIDIKAKDRKFGIANSKADSKVVDEGSIMDQALQITSTAPSIMLTKNETEALDSVLQNLIFGKGSKMLKRQSLSSFYLSTLMYVSSEKWSFWLNGQKYSLDHNDTDLIVKEVSNKYVTLELTINNIDKIAPSWMNKLTSYGNNQFVNNSKTIRVITDEAQEGDVQAKIVFTLKPNQQFDLTNMAIIEGRNLG